jgi:GNAT superfamily N-acetyltransferase
MLTPVTLAAIDEYWAAELGLPPGLLREPGVHVVALSGGMRDYRGAYLLRRESSVIVAVAAQRVEWARQAVQGCSPATVFDPVFLAGLFGSTVERIIGPAYQGFVDAATFRPVDGRATRSLTGADTPALQRLRAACDAIEWEHSAVKSDHLASVFACFVGGALAAAGILMRGRDRIGSLGIITHPAHRGQGYGRAVVSAMTAYALDTGLIPRYQTLLANAQSVGIARSLGFVAYGATLAVRLHDGEPPG